eukprot:TRINITY_DN12868_c0_g2_i1.p1 TRINITY_DN12868_c0_g2~~TRINITY_DN12868_c0_g2_i1.p1  ORF type:complete len:211 (-),score=45.03 TRINITY_DN12868_c0_g2_i1:28-660(-)
MTVKLQACHEKLEDEQAARELLLQETKAQREEVDAAHVTHARLFQLQQNLNEMAAENATLQLNHDALRQELAFSALTAGGVDQEMFDSDSGEMILVPALSSMSPSDAYDVYMENCTLRSQLHQVKRQLSQAVQEFEMQCEVRHASGLADTRETLEQLQACEAERDRLQLELDRARHAPCLLYTSDAADEEDSVDLGGRRIHKKMNRIQFK